MKLIGIGLVLALVCGCGGGGGDAASASAGLTVQQLAEDCVAGDLTDLAGLLDLLQSLLNTDAGGPQPEFDLLAGILDGGIVPWTMDLDADGVPDLGGRVFFTDQAGKVTIPLDLDQLLNEGLPDTLLDVLAQIPDGTTLHVEFDFDTLILGDATSTSGDGELFFTFHGGVPTSASGSGTIDADACRFDFSFSGVDFNSLQAGGFPVADIDFDLVSGTNRLRGTASLDGTGTARVSASLNNGPTEVFSLDLNSAGG